MNHNHRTPNNQSEDRFIEAVARLEAGEPIETILASVPAKERPELADMLHIIQMTQQIQEAPVPLPSPARRAAAKQNFLQAAAALRQEREQQIASVSVAEARQKAAAVARSRAKRRSFVPAYPERINWLDRFLVGLNSIFGPRSLRLAPLIALLALVIFSTSSVVSVAQAAVPGDLAYSIKQWMRKQELELAPAAQREFVRQAQERELAEDVKKAAAKADNNSAIIQTQETQVYYGRNGRILKIGGLNVMDRYQPDANMEVFREMTIEGDLQPGSLVSLVYQIMPGQSDTVQGVSLRVEGVPSEPIEIPAIIPAAETEIPVVESEVAGCTVTQPEGWVAYAVLPGDNLTFLANRGGTTVEELMKVNCLDSEAMWIGESLYLPGKALEENVSGRRCAAELPEGWVEYRVRIGDNLTVLAERGGVTVADLIEVNCLSSDTIVLDSILYIPGDAPAE